MRERREESAEKDLDRDRRFEAMMGNLLRIGVSIAALLVLAGAVMFLFEHGSQTPNYAVFKGQPADLTTPSGIVAECLKLRSRGIIMLGLVTLILTPIARVLFALIGFAIKKDRVYTAVSVIVLAILLLGFFDVI
ncbi:MAG: DUF1634 domain-containing protein [Acidobacteriota bacterium]